LDYFAQRQTKGSGKQPADRLPCTDCHSLDKKTFEPAAPGADGHKPCSDSRCHGPRLNLATSAPFCVACHEKADRFGASEPGMIHRADTEREFGWRINHRRHLQVPGLNQCDTCHKMEKRVTGDVVTVDVHRPDHSDCATCHGRQKSEPSLQRCNSCHVLGEASKPKPAGGGIWRVYEKFSHDHHRLDVRTAKPRPGGMGRGWSRYDQATAQTLSCSTCHASAARSDSLKDMDVLGACAMEKTCMGQCHNGKWAFQGSGTNLKDCLLCHSNVDENTPAPASHCGEK
jgi:hypothetical protein